MRKLFLIVFYFAAAISFSQNTDSLRTILKRAKQDTNRVNGLSELSQFFASSNPDTALILGNQALVLSQELDFKKGEAWAEYRIGRAYDFKSNFKEAILHFNKAIEISAPFLISKKLIEIRSAKQIIGKTLGNIGLLYHDKAEYDKALKYYLKGLSLSEEAGDKQSIGMTFGNIGNLYFEQSNYSKALEYHQNALKIKKEVGDTYGIIITLNNLGHLHSVQYDYINALDSYFKGIDMCKKLGNKQLIGDFMGNIAYVYHSQSNYPKAIEYYFKTLKLNEENDDKSATFKTLENIGNVYISQSNYPMGLEYYLKSLKLEQEIGDKSGMSITLCNLGNLYRDQSNYPKAMEYFMKALNIAEEINDTPQIGNVLGSIGNVYVNLFNYPKALEYYSKSLKIADKEGDRQGFGLTLGNIGSVYEKIGNLKEAEINFKMALAVLQEIGAREDEMNQHENLSILYEKTNQPALALKHYKKFITMRDTIFSQQNAEKLIRSEMNHDYEKQNLIAEAKHQKEIEKQKAIAEERNRKQKVITYSVVVGLLMLFVFTVFIFKSNRQKQKANQIIIQQKSEVESQKHEIEQKHKEITDSINYAERIQRSFLATKEILDENLKNYFVFFKPKDIVSGDFYWAGKLRDGNFALVTADSTGHGVPGAIMSLLNITSLEKAIENSHQPSHILELTRKTIIDRLKKDGSPEGGKDGMDCSLTVYDFKNKRLMIAAANNPVWIARSNEIIEIKADKIPVGKHHMDSVSYTQHEIQLQTGDVIYTLTDGFPDQFGGEKGKKFMSKKLRELLAANAQLPMNVQQELLETTFKNWINNLEQVDDVTIIGVRV